MDSVQRLLSDAKHLSTRQKEVLLCALEYNRPLGFQETTFVSEFMVDFDGPRAAAAAGFRHPFLMSQKLLHEKRRPAIFNAIQDLVAAHQEETRLTADYVRDYIHEVLEFCPTDYFLPSENGMTLMDRAVYAKMPPNIKRLIESVELKNVRGEWVLSVKFISKSAALAMAARYTLVQKAQVTTTAVPWDKIASGEERDALEDKIAEVRRGVDVNADKAAVA